MTLQKIGPATAKVGQALVYHIIVRNIGNTPAIGVRIEDEIPVHARFMRGDSEPRIQSDKAIWAFSSLAPGAEKRLTLELKAVGEGVINTTTTLSVGVTTMVRTRISPSALSLHIVGPSQVALGQKVTFDAVIQNHTGSPLRGLLLHVSLPEALRHPVGRSIEGDLDELPPGSSKKVKISTTTVVPGHHALQASIIGSEGVITTAQAQIEVGSGGLEVIQPPAKKLLLDRTNQLRIEIINRNDHPVRNVVVMNNLPQGVEFLGASDQGLYRPDSRLLHWYVGQLEPGRIRTLVYEVKPNRTGSLSNEVIVRAEDLPENRSRGVLQVQGFSDLLVEVVGRDPQLEIGKETVYQVRVRNQGNVPANNVELEIEIPEGMTPGHAQGQRVFADRGSNSCLRHCLSSIRVAKLFFTWVPSVAAPESEAYEYRFPAINTPRPSPMKNERWSIRISRT